MRNWGLKCSWMKRENGHAMSGGGGGGGYASGVCWCCGENDNARRRAAGVGVAMPWWPAELRHYCR